MLFFGRRITPSAPSVWIIRAVLEESYFGSKSIEHFLRSYSQSAAARTINACFVIKVRARGTTIT